MNCPICNFPDARAFIEVKVDAAPVDGGNGPNLWMRKIMCRNCWAERKSMLTEAMDCVGENEGSDGDVSESA